MSNYPNQLDDDASITRVDDNLTEIGALAINQLRSAVFAVEQELGLGLSGSAGTLADRLGVSINANGTLKTSAIVAAGAIVGPVTNAEVSPTAAIAESKLALTYTTQSLYNEIQNLHTDVNNILDITSDLSLDFLKHLNGQNPLTSSANARHVVSHIDMNAEPTDSRDAAYAWPNGIAPRDKAGSLRGSNLAEFLYDLNDEIVRHQNATGTVSTTADTYGHPASAISLDSDDFVVLPRTLKDVQGFATAVDRASFGATANHQQNHHTNGVSRTCRGSILSTDGYGQSIIPYTACKTYLATGGASTTVDNNVNGDDIIEFVPTPDTTFYFDSLFAQVRAGDVLTVNHGAIETQYIIESVRYDFDNSNPPNRTYLVRVNGRNIQDSTTAVARIDRPQYSDNKFGVLTLAQADNNFGEIPSLTVGHPRGASVLGIGFNPTKLDSTHYNLYLELYPTGNPFDKSIILPAVDVTGNVGATPGKYTLDSVIETVNAAFRKEGFNFRFVAFAHNGEFGLMLADAVNNASFSIISGALDSNGVLIPDIFVNNVIGDAVEGAIDVFGVGFTGTAAVDGLGLGRNGANVASPLFKTSYLNINQAQAPTKVFVPLKNKNYYVNGNERSTLNPVSDGYTDGYGDQYWLATSISKTVIPTQTVKVQYSVPLDLRDADLRPGKTILVQPVLLKSDLKYNDIDYGRFIISNVTYSVCDGYAGNDQTIIEVYNAVHATGNAIATVNVDIPVKLYFTDDTISFNALNIANSASSDKFKRFFEAYVDVNGHTFTHERLRYNLSTGNNQITKFNVVKVAPKLRGYLNGSIRQIKLRITSYNATTGLYSGYLGNSASQRGLTVTGKKGEVTRFYDETGVDYVDVIYDVNETVSTYTDVDLTMDLFPSLQLDQEVFFLGTVLYNELTNRLTYLRDGRQFGNLSEQEFSDSAIDFVTSGDRFTHQNGVVRGLEYRYGGNGPGGSTMILSFTGGLALVNGKYTAVNNFTVNLPIVKEYYSATPYDYMLWAACVNARAEIQLIPLTDYDVAGSGIIDPTRIIMVQNPVNNQTYSLESVLFTDLVTKRKDLTPIALVRTNVVGANSGTFTVSDCRKLIRDDSSASVLVWTSDTNSGNFANFTALNNWLKYHATFNNTVRVRGSFAIAANTTFDYVNPVKYVGDGATFTLTGTTLFTLGNNVEFDGIKFVYVPSTDGSYSTNNLVNSTSGMMFCNVTANKNITIKNCEFTTATAERHPFISFNFSATTASLQHLTIQNNKFSYSGAADDKRAVIAIAGPSAAPGADEYAYLVNAVIDGNVCDKNQMISISSDYNVGTSTVRNAIVPINCRIINNVCGAINFLTRQHVPISTYNTTVIADKENMLRISGNTCRFIYSGTNAGIFLVGGGGTRAPMALGTGIFSGSTIMTENNVSWIHTALRIPSGTGFQNPVVIIKNNRITAYNPTFMSPHYFGFSTVNTAIIVDSVSGA